MSSQEEIKDAAAEFKRQADLVRANLKAAERALKVEERTGKKK